MSVLDENTVIAAWWKAVFSPFDRDDEDWWSATVSLAEQGRQVTAPDPWVGCLLVRDQELLAAGFHAEVGSPHAEAMALARAARAGIDVRGSRCYTTLEPCVGDACTAAGLPTMPARTCSRQLIEAGVAEVRIACLDPDPRVAGRGVAALREAGVRVVVLDEQDPSAVRVRESLAPYLYQRRSGLAHCVVKVALSLDGAIACPDGSSMWITGPEARAHCHARHLGAQVVMVGAETARLDQTHCCDDGPWWVVVTTDPSSVLRLLPASSSAPGGAKVRLLATSNPTGSDLVRVLPSDPCHPEGHIHPSTLLAYCAAELGALQVVVEGGVRLHDEFLRVPRLVQELHLYTGNCLLGGSDQQSRYQWPQLTYARTISEKWEWDLLETDTLGSTVFRRYRLPALPARVEAAVRALQEGRLVCVGDESDRENEADLVGSVRSLTAEQLLFLHRHTTGKVCVSVPESWAAHLALPPMVAHNEDPLGTNFSVTCDWRDSTTGQAVSERLTTMRALGALSSRATDFHRPGHIDPLIARDLEVRQGHTECTSALCALAGQYPPVGFLSEGMHADGSIFANDANTLAFCEQHSIPYVTSRELAAACPRTIAWPARPVCSPLVSCDLPVAKYGRWTLTLYRNPNDEKAPHKVMTLGNVRVPHTLCRVHSECYTGDTLESLLCDCGWQLREAQRVMAEHGSGVLIILGGHEGRGIGLEAKLRAYQLRQQQPELDTYEANEALHLPRDARTYDDVLPILASLGVPSITLLTTNPHKIHALRPARTRPFQGRSTADSEDYLASKTREHELGRRTCCLPTSSAAQVP